MFTSPPTTSEQSRCSPAACCITSLQWTSSALTAQGRACPNASHVNCNPHTRSGGQRSEVPRALVQRKPLNGGCPRDRWQVASGAADRVRLVIGWVLSSGRSPPLRGSVFQFGRRKWIKMLSVSCERLSRLRWFLLGAETLDGQKRVCARFGRIVLNLIGLSGGRSDSSFSISSDMSASVVFRR